jgi:hypothetical protein
MKGINFVVARVLKIPPLKAFISVNVSLFHESILIVSKWSGLVGLEKHLKSTQLSIVQRGVTVLSL